MRQYSFPILSKALSNAKKRRHQHKLDDWSDCARSRRGWFGCTRLHCLPVFAVICTKVTIVVLLVAWNGLQLCGGIFEKQIGAIAVLSGVEQLEFVPVCLFGTVLPTHGC